MTTPKQEKCEICKKIDAELDAMIRGYAGNYGAAAGAIMDLTREKILECTCRTEPAQQEKCLACVARDKFAKGNCGDSSLHSVLCEWIDLQKVPCTCQPESNREPTIQESLTVEHGGFEEWLRSEGFTHIGLHTQCARIAWQACAKAYEGKLAPGPSGQWQLSCILLQEQLAAKEKDLTQLDFWLKSAVAERDALKAKVAELEGRAK